MADVPAVVFDNGSSWSKVGFAGQETPMRIFPSIVGRPRHGGMMVGMNAPDAYIGEQAQAKRGILTLKYPIEYGMVTNWDDTEKIWHHSFYNEMRCAPEEHPVLISETTLNPSANREKATQIMFETFNVPAFYMANHAVLALHASNLQTGFVVDSGGAITNCVPVYEGHYLPKAIIRSRVPSGRDVSDLLMKKLNERKIEGVEFVTTADRERVHGIKEKCCKVKPPLGGHPTLTLTRRDNTDTATPTTHLDLLPNELFERIDKFAVFGENEKYELPDGTEISLTSNEIYGVAEAIFNPALLGDETLGLPEVIDYTIKKCDEEIRGKMFENIVLAGGNTCFPGMKERLQLELSKFHSSPKVIAPENRKISVWCGGSALASLSTFATQMCILPSEYDETGPALVHSKCF